jgi:BTB/POZ domain
VEKQEIYRNFRNAIIMETQVKIEVNDANEVEIGDQQSVLLKVAGLYASHLLSDINLVVGENQYPAHRVILSASSEVRR